MTCDGEQLSLVHLAFVYLLSEVFVSFVHFLITFFIFLSLSVKGFLYILGDSPSSDVSFANIFPGFVAGLLTLPTSSFTEQRFLVLIKFSASMLSFMVSICGVVSKKSPP